MQNHINIKMTLMLQCYHFLTDFMMSKVKTFFLAKTRVTRLGHSLS